MKTIHNSSYKYLRQRLLDMRNARGMTQEALSRQLGKPQSFVSKVEGGERRLDLVELILWTRALDEDPVTLVAQVAEDMSKSQDLRRRRVALIEK